MTSTDVDVVVAGGGAAGLAAAIPAVIAYNHFLSRLKKMASEMEMFSADYLNLMKRHFFK